MRLLHTSRKAYKEFALACAPDFVILSHRWSNFEVTFQDVEQHHMYSVEDWPLPYTEGVAKIQDACKKAQADGYDWIWIDSCCINRQDPVELQETINSMWRFYSEANKCYAYLADVLPNSAPSTFANSQWWTRGWTLRELLAPHHVEFLDANWTFIGTKLGMCAEIAAITGIHHRILARLRKMQSCTAAERLSWAAHRIVSREEDESYALLGIMGVSLPLLYGEGRARAFERLQVAVYASETDQSLFLFRYTTSLGDLPLVADSPTAFCPYASCTRCLASARHECLPASLSYANLSHYNVWRDDLHELLHIRSGVAWYGTTAVLQLLEIESEEPSSATDWINERRSPSHLAVLNCTNENGTPNAVCLKLLRVADESYVRCHLPPVAACLTEGARKRLRKVKLFVRALKPVNTTSITAQFACELLGADGITWSVPKWDVSATLRSLGPVHISDGNLLELTTFRDPKGTHLPVHAPGWVSLELNPRRGQVEGACVMKVTLEPHTTSWSIKHIAYSTFGTPRTEAPYIPSLGPEDEYEKRPQVDDCFIHIAARTLQLLT